jgi:hypothetical protein
MSSLGQRARARWQAMTLAGRIWWAGAASVATAAVLVLAATSLTDAASPPATGSAAPPPTTTITTGGANGTMGSMPGMAGGTTPAAGSSPTGASTVSTVCPNVQGTTTMADGMVMAPVPTGAPTAAQQAAANHLVADTNAGIARYASLSAATAAGYVPVTNPAGREVHYMDWQTVKSGDVLDPTHPSSLVYANTLKGPVLLGAMYLGSGPCQPGPDVGGPLTQWHAHDNLCLSASHQVIGKADASGTCATGVHNTATYFMLHVWVAPSLAATHQFQADLTRAELVPIIVTGQP